MVWVKAKGISIVKAKGISESPFVKGKSMFSYRECDKLTGSSIFCWDLHCSLRVISQPFLQFCHCCQVLFSLSYRFLLGCQMLCFSFLVVAIWVTAQKWERWGVQWCFLKIGGKICCFWWGWWFLGLHAILVPEGLWCHCSVHFDLSKMVGTCALLHLQVAEADF